MSPVDDKPRHVQDCRCRIDTDGKQVVDIPLTPEGRALVLALVAAD